jgi:hypothetical protein
LQFSTSCYICGHGLLDYYLKIGRLCGREGATEKINEKYAGGRIVENQMELKNRSQRRMILSIQSLFYREVAILFKI